MQEAWGRSLGWKDPLEKGIIVDHLTMSLTGLPNCGLNKGLSKAPHWRREWLSTLVFLPREFHGQRNLAGYTVHGLKESDTTEQLLLSLSSSLFLFYIY